MKLAECNVIIERMKAEQDKVLDMYNKVKLDTTQSSAARLAKMDKLLVGISTWQAARALVLAVAGVQVDSGRKS